MKTIALIVFLWVLWHFFKLIKKRFSLTLSFSSLYSWPTVSPSWTWNRHNLTFVFFQTWRVWVENAYGFSFIRRNVNFPVECEKQGSQRIQTFLFTNVEVSLSLPPLNEDKPKNISDVITFIFQRSISLLTCDQAFFFFWERESAKTVKRTTLQEDLLAGQFAPIMLSTFLSRPEEAYSELTRWSTQSESRKS